MLSKEEYRALKGADLQAAEEIVAQIKASTSPAVKYKESRPIMDIKHMIETSAQLYGDHTAFYQKMEKGGPYKTVSYTEMLDMVNGLGTALIDTGLKGKRIGVSRRQLLSMGDFLSGCFVRYRYCRALGQRAQSPGAETTDHSGRGKLRYFFRALSENF